MKLIVKADDFGYTQAYNEGTIKAIKEGIVTTVDLMLDTPGTIDAIERIKNFPWISVGWHSGHYWGSPVADPHLVPSMVNDEGKFKFRHHPEAKETVNFDEALIELRAEVERCIQLLGRAPDSTRLHGSGPLDQAKKCICEEYGIPYDYIANERNGKVDRLPTQFAESKIITIADHSKYIGCGYDDILLFKDYDPVQWYKNFCDTTREETFITAWHPGFLDDLIVSESSFTACRPKDVLALCSEELKNWIIENQIELVSLTDALYQRKDYQNHLKITNNKLWIKGGSMNGI